MAVGSGHLESLEPQSGQSRASLGVTCWIRYTVDLRKRGRILNAGWKGGVSGHFILQNFLLTLWDGSLGPSKLGRVREETEIGSSILSYDRLMTGSEFSPLGKSACLLEENARSC